MAHPANTLSIVADIGGTNTRVALADGETVLTDTIRRYRNADYPGLESVLRAYLNEENDVDPVATCVAMAGPVRDGVGTLTNLDWSVDKDVLKRATRSEYVAVLNDLQAQGHALGLIAPENLATIVPVPEHSPLAARLVIGVGTGFNAAPVYETAVGRLVPPSECGHANLPIRTDRDLRLLHFVENAHGFPAVEDLLSGRGLERAYAFVTTEAGSPKECAAAEIMSACETGSDPYARDAVQLFVRLLGTVAGNLSLIHLPFGGVFLVGGVARAMKPYMAEFGFEASYKDKGRFAGFMGNFGVQIVEDDYAALTGCASHMSRLMSN
ncbi:ROK family protein [Shimia ponticola]|uniref:glucokinase n=1 Tax=Shimia ponticola TaxID=2582893 RepID=UPI0011BE5A58|nr:ROK family protein [Shimia ponticola]